MLLINSQTEALTRFQLSQAVNIIIYKFKRMNIKHMDMFGPDYQEGFGHPPSVP